MANNSSEMDALISSALEEYIAPIFSYYGSPTLIKGIDEKYYLYIESHSSSSGIEVTKEFASAWINEYNEHWSKIK